MLSGKYEDDFESTLAGDTENAAAINQSHEQAISTDEATTIDVVGQSVKEMSHGGNESMEEGQADYEASEDEDNTLTVSFNDIGSLRRSLERDEMIRESLAGNLTVSV